MIYLFIDASISYSFVRLLIDFYLAIVFSLDLLLYIISYYYIIIRQSI